MFGSLISKSDEVHFAQELSIDCTYLYSYESEFLQKLVKDKKIREARAFKFTYRYIDDVLSINNFRFAKISSIDISSRAGS
jgi:chromosomal replication initiation ATPase DnaA